ncbi:MAG: DsbA family protein [Rubrobacter sp.]|nr:DsbA family protein [Rubrobacter sp.]
MPAFEAAWCAFRQGEEAGLDYDLRVRRAFFAESHNIGRLEVLLKLAAEAGLETESFARALGSSEAREAVLEEARMSKGRYKVRGTPTPVLGDGTKMKHPIAFSRLKKRRVVGVGELPCYGESCLVQTRELFEQALL